MTALSKHWHATQAGPSLSYSVLTSTSRGRSHSWLLVDEEMETENRNIFPVSTCIYQASCMGMRPGGTAGGAAVRLCSQPLACWGTDGPARPPARALAQEGRGGSAQAAGARDLRRDFHCRKPSSPALTGDRFLLAPPRTVPALGHLEVHKFPERQKGLRAQQSARPALLLP